MGFVETSYYRQKKDQEFHWWSCMKRSEGSEGSSSLWYHTFICWRSAQGSVTASYSQSVEPAKDPARTLGKRGVDTGYLKCSQHCINCTQSTKLISFIHYLLTCHSHSCSLCFVIGVENITKLNLTSGGIRIMIKPLFSIQINMVLPVTYLVEGWALMKDF